jgi:hypothetical protein
VNPKETPVPNTNRNELDKLDFMFHEVALAEAEHGVSSRDERRQEREILAVLHSRIAERRRKLFDVPTPEPASLGPIPAKLSRWTRDALLARIATLAETYPGAVQYAHKDLSGLSDNDLRRLVQLLDYPNHEESSS